MYARRRGRRADGEDAGARCAFRGVLRRRASATCASGSSRGASSTRAQRGGHGGALAEAYGADVRKARLAGLLHDWDKGTPTTRSASAPATWAWTWIRSCSRRCRGFCTARRPRRRSRGSFRASPPTCCRRSSGTPPAATGMSDLDMVVYVADAIEPGRDFGGLDELRSAGGAGAARGAVPGDVRAHLADAREAAQAASSGDGGGVEPLRGPLRTRGGERRKEQRERPTTMRADFARVRPHRGACGGREEGHRHHGAGGARPHRRDGLLRHRHGGEQPPGGGHRGRDRGGRARAGAA